MKWEKKFYVSCDGDVVIAKYDRQRTYLLRFATAVEAECFVKEFQSAQEEIEKNGKLKDKIGITADCCSDTQVKFSFYKKERTIRMCCKLETVNEMLEFYRRLRSQILRYSS